MENCCSKVENVGLSNVYFLLTTGVRTQTPTILETTPSNYCQTISIRLWNYAYTHSTFTIDNLWRWMNVGFHPFTGKCGTSRLPSSSRLLSSARFRHVSRQLYAHPLCPHYENKHFFCVVLVRSLWEELLLNKSFLLPVAVSFRSHRQ